MVLYRLDLDPQTLRLASPSQTRSELFAPPSPRHQARPTRRPWIYLRKRHRRSSHPSVSISGLRTDVSFVTEPRMGAGQRADQRICIACIADLLPGSSVDRPPDCFRSVASQLRARCTPSAAGGSSREGDVSQDDRTDGEPRPHPVLCPSPCLELTSLSTSA